MTNDEEIRALNEKLIELNEVTAKLETKLATTPYSEETAPMRAMMEQMLGELRRMDNNLKAMLRISNENESEGGCNNGNY